MTDKKSDLLRRIDLFLTNHPDVTYSDQKERVMKGLMGNIQKHGMAYCPCRRVIPDMKTMDKYVCPCIMAMDDINLQGHCHCNLFKKK